ncbi:hypothetical protein DL95DRAFT_3630 [Leptodontidium sp. 2 PMI_412]|nr:hypothetical protein DL95DRAFT_3630 [Leptodontidium sp. 2 PMI_412]
MVLIISMGTRGNDEPTRIEIHRFKRSRKKERKEQRKIKILSLKPLHLGRSLLCTSYAQPARLSRCVCVCVCVWVQACPVYGPGSNSQIPKLPRPEPCAPFHKYNLCV